MSYEDFNCKKCGEKLSVLKAVIKGNLVVIVGKCPRKHGNKLILSLENKDLWIDEFASGVMTCVCEHPLKIKTKISKGIHIILILQCPEHGIIKKIIPTPLWDQIEHSDYLKFIEEGIPNAPSISSPSILVPPPNPDDEKASNWAYNSSSIQSNSSNSNNSETIKFCPSCGEKVVPGSYFCTFCGQELK